MDDNKLNSFETMEYDFLNKNIIDHFEEQVKRNPDAVAVVTKDETLTYGSLNSKANIIANYLREHGVGENDIVGVIISRSIEMIIAIYAIMKAGAAYLPMSVEYPQKRVEFIIADSGIKFILGCRELKSTYKDRVNYIDLIVLCTFVGDD